MQRGQHTSPKISGPILRFFRGVVRRYFRRHFRSVQAQHAEQLRQTNGPLIVYGNHSSWWDPMLIVLLGEVLLPGRRHYAPIDARALQQYPILRKLGIFPVETSSSRGAAQFIRTAEAVLHDGGVLWLTPQGRFADPREAALAFKPGLGALAVRMPAVPLIPLAVEYTLCDERLPETRLHFAPPVAITSGASTEQATRELEAALATAMGALREASMRRDASAFTTLFTGARGTGGAYAVIRRIRALLGGKDVKLDHTQRANG